MRSRSRALTCFKQVGLRLGDPNVLVFTARRRGRCRSTMAGVTVVCGIRVKPSSASARPNGANQPAGRRVQGWPERVSVRIGDELAGPLEAEAAALGLPPSKWIEALVRGRLQRRPTISRPDELAFIAVQLELRRIGVHIHHLLDQIAPDAAPDPEVVRQLSAHADDMRGHLARLRAAFRGNLAYWDAGP